MLPVPHVFSRCWPAARGGVHVRPADCMYKYSGIVARYCTIVTEANQEFLQSCSEAVADTGTLNPPL